MDASVSERAAAYYEQGDLADRDPSEDLDGFILSLRNGNREEDRRTVIEAAHRWERKA